MKGKKTGGKVKGSKNEKTKQWEALGEAIITTHAERFNRILAAADDDLFMRNYAQMLEYFKPKLARSEIKQDGPTEHIVTHVTRTIISKKV